MQQYHSIAGDLASPKGFRAYWSASPNGTAIVFVHGFYGEAVGTWSQFERLLPSEPACRGCDIIFFKYDSVYTPSPTSGAELYVFLKQLCRTPAAVIKADAPATRPARFRYKRVLLVAHSLGAVVCRLALLTMHRNGDRWETRMDLVLFAPAHLGARAVHLLALLSPISYIGNWVPLLRYRYPVIEELGINQQGDPPRLLKDLKEETKRAIEDSADYLNARKVFFGKKEKVVVVGNFCGDDGFENNRALAVLSNKGHKDICKPTANYRLPVDAVLEVLKRP